MLKGVGVSAGTGIGRALLVEDYAPVYTPVIVKDADAEKQRFHKALKQYCDKAVLQAEALEQSAGKEEAEIMYGHIGIATDPFLIEESERMIERGKCAEEAIESLCDMFISIFSASGDDLTRQRAADVRDVKKGVLGILLGVAECRLSDAPKDTILVVRELTPSMTAELNKDNIAGIVTETGGLTSHSAILARAMEIPVVMGVPDAVVNIHDGDCVITDGSEGDVIVSPDEALLQQYRHKREEQLQEKQALEQFRGCPTVTADGLPLKIFCNIGTPRDAVSVVEHDGEGVGLFRTEFVFMDRLSAPSEEEQFEAYRRAVLALENRTLIIRTLDVGGDKEIPYMNLPKEENPFLGLRAIRYCLQQPEFFKIQLRAILRSSAYGTVYMMFPMITCLEELREGKRLLEEAKEELRQRSLPFDEHIRVGIMIETASAAALADLLAEESDFFSIGTNDLTGYTMACDRGNGAVADLYSPFQPSVLRMIRHTIACAREKKIPVGMCGEAAADPRMIPLLISFGLNVFSVSAPAVLRVRQAIRSFDKASADEIAAKALSFKTKNEALSFLNARLCQAR